jgi:hypothetical protein
MTPKPNRARAGWLAGAVLSLTACTAAPPPDFAAAPGSMAPELTAGADGRAYLSWLEPDGSGHALRFAVRDGSGWSAPRTVARGEHWLANWADFPSVTALGNGALAAHWLVLRPGANHAYDIALAFSRDGGQTWTAPVTPHDDGTDTGHGFVTLIPRTDSLQMVWLDGREMAGLAAEEAEAHGAMTLRYAEFDATGRLRESALLDARVCSCCQTGAVAAGADLLVAYRDRSEDEIRDIALVARRAGDWSASRPAFDEGWRIEACPVNGPSVDAALGAAVVAWFTGSGGEPQVQAAFIDRSGATAGRPLRVDVGRALGRVDVVLTGPDSALVSWVELAGEAAQVRVRRVYRDGRMDMPETLVRVDPSRLSGFPRMVRSGRDVLIAWTEGDRTAPRVRATVLQARGSG